MLQSVYAENITKSNAIAVRNIEVTNLASENSQNHINIGAVATAKLFAGHRNESNFAEEYMIPIHFLI